MMYEVIDNFLEQDEFIKIKSLLESNMFPWFYQYKVTGTKDIESAFYLTHLFYDNYKPNSAFYSVLSPVIKKLNPITLIRAKGNFYPNLGRYVENEPHVDYDFQNRAAVFYINTNDGATILNDGTRIDSIENRVLLFDGNSIHTSTHCTDQPYRMNINFNYL